MPFSYRIVTKTYFTAIRLASIFNPKAKLMLAGRKNWKNELITKIDTNSKYIWFHSASLGEFEQGRPLIEKIKSEKPEYKIILTFFSPSGYEPRKNYKFADIVSYLPFDSPKNALDFVKIVNPKLAIFIKYDIWYYFLKNLKEYNVPTYLISAIFRENQIFFKSYGKSYKKALGFFDKIFLQNKESEILLGKYGFNNTVVCGDTRIDRVISISKQEYNNSILEKFCENKRCFVYGSTWLEDEKILANFINTSPEDFVFIIAPHEVNEKNIENIENTFKVNSQRFSEIIELKSDTRLIIIDTIGILSKIYRFAEIAYVGGGFGKGIHNILEAVVYNIPVVIGPNYKKFNEAVQLVKNQVVFSVNSSNDYVNIMKLLVGDGDIVMISGNNAKAYINASMGTTQIIFDNLQLI